MTARITPYADGGEVGERVDAPKRIQRRRAKGWRMPEGAVCVDRSTPWGNPFVVGVDGTAENCVRLYRAVMSGAICLTCQAMPSDQMKANAYVAANIEHLRGKDLACFCREGQPCHADVLLELANAPTTPEPRGCPTPGACSCTVMDADVAVARARDRERRMHIVNLEQCSLFVDSDPIKRAMTDAAAFLRALAADAQQGE